MDQAKFEELKRKLRHDKTLADVWSYFLDHIGHNPQFMAKGEQTVNAFLETVLHKVAEQMFPGDCEISHMLLTRIPGKHFIHGGFQIGGRFCGLFFFEETGAGLIAVADKPPSIEAKYARFSGYAVKKPGEPSLN